MTVKNHTTILDLVYDVILKRMQSSPENSYVAFLLDGGTDRVLKKIWLKTLFWLEQKF